MDALTNPQPSGLIPNFPATPPRGMQRIALPYLNRTITIAVEDITCLQGEGNYTFVFTRDKKRYLISKTLKEFERNLDGALFLRVHKSFMINLAYVVKTRFTTDRTIQLTDGHDITVSRRRIKEISQRLSAYQREAYN
ncbi:LytR/AlgR family response regulator transcription factor [Arsenicibacter rosenii]|uniref:Histidine kinase n=1 Tax=Arsenicibacter rosenii TaxID=1750698 RepID=A0A1S2VMB4_9BACT|nr:LytTR family DNA-binding domain-containing protein [Arsenicibacter rosenii]OIN59903.1 histidine kinase [Arsenicibacter rosenii]